MKNSILIIFFMSVAYSCNKNTVTKITPPEPFRPPITITVMEIFTNTPIAGASVSLKSCANFDFELGCTSYATISILSTNSQGKVSIPGNLHVDAIGVKHNKYWEVRRTSVQDITLTPISNIEVSIKKIHSYSPTDILYVGTRPVECGFGCLSNLRAIGLPADTVIHIDGYGYSDNIVSWYVNYLSTDTLHSSPSFFINAFDSARIAVEY